MFNGIGDEDKFHEECGILGVFGASPESISRICYCGLFALQHRGQESAGMAVSNGKALTLHKNMGLVHEVFTQDVLDNMKGSAAVGHVRYSTTGSSSVINAQPIMFRYSKGMLALAHNGNLTNADELRKSLFASGSTFQSTNDTEVIVNMIARFSQDTIEEAIRKSMIELKGSYSLAVLTEDKLIGVRDPYGNRPLCLGKFGDAFIIASESCALNGIGAEFVRDIEPGEIVIIDKNGVKSIKAVNKPCKRICIFEYIYFARPDSTLDGHSVIKARREMGRQLAREHKIDADIVIPVPDSGIPAARGYAEESGIVYEEGLMKNRYIGRTFIQPNQETRALGVRLKLNPIIDIIKDKRVIVIDDSIIRGTTTGKIVRMLRDAGAKEVHVIISSPPVAYPCFFGIDMSSRRDLIAAQKSIEEIREYIGADSLHYLSIEGLINCFGTKDFCTSCFNGDYYTDIPKDEESSKFILEA